VNPEISLARRIWAWLVGHATTVLIAVLSLWLAGHFLLAEWRAASTAKADAGLAGNVAAATAESAHDAVSTVTTNITNERNITNEVNRAQNAVYAAPDGASADAAGRAGLCALNRDLCPAPSVQQPSP
jgi:hypothetical protein